jgi:tetratricopeptide (TPR) repeat protein
MFKLLKKKEIFCVLLIFVVFCCGCSNNKYNNRGNFNTAFVEDLCKAKKYDEALRNIDIFLKKYPNNRKAISMKGYALISSGKNEDGFILLMKLIANSANDDVDLNNISWACNNLHLYKMANEYIDISLKMKPNSDKACVNKGNALQGLKKYDEAIQYFDKALDLNPKCSFALWGKGLCLYNKKEYRESIQYFKQYHKLRSDDKSSNYYITNSYLKLKDYNGAIDEFNSEINENPNNFSAYISLAKIYIAQKDYDKAITCYDSIINKSPDYADAYYDKSICLVKLGKKDEACDNLKLAIKYDEELSYDIQNDPEFDSLRNYNKFRALFNNA